MADDANALTPKPRLPTEADYEAIVATVTQTARGRWFLAEYAKRNRNADTRMVLDAVARIETSMARPAADDGPAVAAVIAEARHRVAELVANGKSSREAMLIHVQALHEITWTLREWGTDSAICDRLDAHAGAIADTPAAPDLNGLQAIFDDLQRRDDAGGTMIAAGPAPQASVAATSVAAANVDAAVAALKPQTLGSALLTQGLVPVPRGSDPLAPLRRMTQSEKIALFT